MGGIDAGGGGVPDLEAGRDDAGISSGSAVRTVAISGGGGVVAGSDSEAGGVPEIDRGGVDPCLDAVSAVSTSFARGDGPVGLGAAAWGSAANAAASRAGDSGIGLGAVDALTVGGGGVVLILLRDVVEPSRSSLPETEPAMDAVSESCGGGGVTEFPRFGKPGMVNADVRRAIAPPTRERRVDFLWGVGGVAMVVERVKARGKK